jgi:hypothetical protein
MKNKNRFLLVAAGVLFAGAAPSHAQTSNGMLTWYIYIAGLGTHGALVVQTSNVLTPSSVDLGPLYNQPPVVMGYPIESISGRVTLAENDSETVSMLLTPGTQGNVVTGCTGFFNLEGNIFPVACASANMTVDNLIVPHMYGRAPGLDNAGIGFAANWANTNPQAVDTIAYINDFIQLYTVSGQPYMLDLAVWGGASPFNITVSSPEPDTLALAGLGLSGIWLTRRSRRGRGSNRGA